jgi:hypothetical protein
MGYFEEVAQEGSETDQHNVERSICLHAFSDLSHVPAATFVCLLKDCYSYGMPMKKNAYSGTYTFTMYIYSCHNLDEASSVSLCS